MSTIPSNDPSIYTSLDGLSALQKNAIVRPDNPPPGIAGFVFDIPLEDAIELTAASTDHYVESNKAIQDHIVLKPEQITVRGLVGEIVMTQAQQDSIIKTLDALPINDTLLPEYNDVAQQDIDNKEAQQALDQQTLTDNDSLLAMYESQSGAQDTRQARIFGYFYQLWLGRQLFTVDTPWGVLTDMHILTIKANQSDESKFFSEFTIVFKKIRFVNELQVQPGQISGRAAQQHQASNNNGLLGGDTPTPEQSSSILYGLIEQTQQP